MSSPPSQKVQPRVATSYNQIASQYLAWTESRPSPRLRYIDKLLSYLSSSTHPIQASEIKILELGSGAGVPVTLYLSERVGCVVANDVSEGMLELARERLSTQGPDRRGNIVFVEGDMLQLEFGREEFDGVVTFFSLFHLPVAEQRIMLGKVGGWLKEGGMLVCNFGAADRGERDTDEGEWAEFFGAPMFWANLGLEGSPEMIKKAGFEVVECEVLDATDGEEKLREDDPDAGVRFVWVVARKGGS